MPQVTYPAQSTTHRHGQAGTNQFQWNNLNPTVPGVTNWRLRVGTSPYGYNLYLGTVAGGQYWASPVNLMTNGQTLYTVVEWSTNNGASWSYGTLSSFYCTA